MSSEFRGICCAIRPIGFLSNCSHPDVGSSHLSDGRVSGVAERCCDSGEPSGRSGVLEQDFELFHTYCCSWTPKRPDLGRCVATSPDPRPILAELYCPNLSKCYQCWGQSLGGVATCSPLADGAGLGGSRQVFGSNGVFRIGGGGGGSRNRMGWALPALAERTNSSIAPANICFQRVRSMAGLFLFHGYRDDRGTPEFPFLPPNPRTIAIPFRIFFGFSNEPQAHLQKDFGSQCTVAVGAIDQNARRTRKGILTFKLKGRE